VRNVDVIETNFFLSTAISDLLEELIDTANYIDKLSLGDTFK